MTLIRMATDTRENIMKKSLPAVKLSRLIFVGLRGAAYYSLGFLELGEPKGDFILALSFLVELFSDPESSLGNSFDDTFE